MRQITWEERCDLIKRIRGDYPKCFGNYNDISMRALCGDRYIPPRWMCEKLAESTERCKVCIKMCKERKND